MTRTESVRVARTGTLRVSRTGTLRVIRIGALRSLQSGGEDSEQKQMTPPIVGPRDLLTVPFASDGLPNDRGHRSLSSP